MIPFSNDDVLFASIFVLRSLQSGNHEYAERERQYTGIYDGFFQEGKTEREGASELNINEPQKPKT